MSRAEIMRMLHRQVAQDERGAGPVGGESGYTGGESGYTGGMRRPRAARARFTAALREAHAPAVAALGGAKARQGLAAYHAWKSTQPAGMSREALKMAWRHHKNATQSAAAGGKRRARRAGAGSASAGGAAGLVGGAAGSASVGGFIGQKEAAAAIRAHLRNMKSEANMRTFNELSAYKALKAQHPLKVFNQRGATDEALHAALRALQVSPEIIARTRVGRARRQPRAAAAPRPPRMSAWQRAQAAQAAAQQELDAAREENALINELLAGME